MSYTDRTPITGDTTLADLVTERPDLSACLDALGLDYCCGGNRSLARAAAEAALDLDAVLAELRSRPGVPIEPGWFGIDGLVDHLVATHHAYVREALPRLVALADKVATVHGANHPELIDVASLVWELHADLMPHLIKEEEVLFPMIRSLTSETAAPAMRSVGLHRPILAMGADHDTVGALLGRLRRRAGDYRVPDDGCASYRALFAGLAEFEADTHRHVHEENNLLFPAALAAAAANPST